MRIIITAAFCFLLLSAGLTVHAAEEAPAASPATLEVQEAPAPASAELPLELQEPEWMKAKPGSQISDCGYGPPTCPPGCQCVEVRGEERCYC